MKNTNKILTLLLLAFSTILYSCESTVSPKPPEVTITGTTLFIVSEGGFGKNNAQLDAYSIKGNDTTFTQNIIQPLGDIGNDIQFFGKKLYIVLENSNKIEVVNPDSIADRTSIQFPGQVTPFKMAQVSSTEVWVTEFKNKQIAVMNLNSNTLTSTINIDTAQQDIGIFGGKAFICTNSNKLEVIDVATKQVLSNKYIGDSPAQVMIDSSRSSVIVLTYGNFGVSQPKILWVDPVTFSITDSITLPSTDFINVLIPAGSVAYVTYGDRTDKLDLATHKFSSFLTKGYYKGYFDPVNNELILGDAKDFSSPGVVDIFDATSGTLKKTLNSGVSPGHFAIYRK